MLHYFYSNYLRFLFNKLDEQLTSTFFLHEHRITEIQLVIEY